MRARSRLFRRVGYVVVCIEIGVKDSKRFVTVFTFSTRENIVSYRF